MQSKIGSPKSLLKELDARALKQFSQNFLTSPHWRDRLTSATLSHDPPFVWEIGPGLGALTAQLIEKSKAAITVFEIDRKLAAALRERWEDAIHIVEGDFLATDLSTLFPSEGYVTLLSNLPYHLSSPILFKLLETRERFDRLVFTFQREFGERLLASPRTKDYSGLSVLAQVFFTVEKIGILPPNAFFPAPKVESIALTLVPKVGVAHFNTLQRLVRTAFMHRRKKLISNLKSSYPSIDWAAQLARLGLSQDVRPEVLSPEHYVELSKSLS